jgi:hypothetical protein
VEQRLDIGVCTACGAVSTAAATSCSRCGGRIKTGPLARVEIAWGIHHPLPAGLLDKAARRTGKRLEAVQSRLREIIGQAYDQGLSVRDTADRIAAAIPAIDPRQAVVLARTDLISLSNGASLAAAQWAGMSFKVWMATLDGQTRVEHANLHGHAVPINNRFIVGGEEADYPGDPILSDAMAANCRCTLVYAETLDEVRELLPLNKGTFEPGTGP